MLCMNVLECKGKPSAAARCWMATRAAGMATVCPVLALEHPIPCSCSRAEAVQAGLVQSSVWGITQEVVFHVPCGWWERKGNLRAAPRALALPGRAKLLSAAGRGKPCQWLLLCGNKSDNIHSGNSNETENGYNPFIITAQSPVPQMANSDGAGVMPGCSPSARQTQALGFQPLSMPTMGCPKGHRL